MELRKLVGNALACSARRLFRLRSHLPISHEHAPGDSFLPPGPLRAATVNSTPSSNQKLRYDSVTWNAMVSAIVSACAIGARIFESEMRSSATRLPTLEQPPFQLDAPYARSA